MVEVGLLNVVIKRKSKKTLGFEVEKREEDGFYYITKVPPNCKTVGVGDRVLEINGTTHLNFKNEKNANSLVESIRLDVVPADSDESDDEESESESDEEYEEVSKLKNKTKLASAAAAAEAAASSKKTTKRSKKNDDESADKVDESEEEEDWDDSSEDRGAGRGKKKAAKQNDKDEDDSMSKDSDDGDDDDDTSGDQEDDEDRDFVKTSAAKRNENYDDDEEEENWDRPYVSKYKPNEKFMISVAMKDADSDQLGLDLVEFKSGKGKFSRNDLFVKNVDRGPFYKTALDRGDKLISINGKKIPEKIKTAEDAMELLASKPKAAIFAVRPDPKDKGYIWLMENH
mmetsp:Transcript_25464/g.70126  ORF Transcript_25464/g.70126 Transcript_25464/m.70126 type:complete len:343 (-) Transcript_25464:700-1728(-)